MKEKLFLILIATGILFANEGDYIKKKPKLIETKKEEVKEIPSSFKSLEDKKNDFKYQESDFKKDTNFKKSDYSNMHKKEYKEEDFNFLKQNEQLKKQQDKSFENIKNFFGPDYANKEKMKDDSFTGGD